MTTQYTPILKLALPVTGELSGTWGSVVNDNITSMVEQAVAGLSTINTWTANAHALTTADGTSSEARCAMLVLATGAGGTALTAAGEVICPAASKLYVVKNGSAYAVTVKTSAGTGVAIPAGDTAFVFCDGTNVNACVTTIVNGHISGNLTVDGNTTLGDATSDTITATARFNTDLLPSTDNARDLGSSGNSWRTLYCDTSVLTPLVTATNLQVTNIKANDGTAVAVLTDSTGALDISKAVTFSATTENISLGASQTTGTFVLGGTAATGAITLDASTKTHTLNVGSGATENALTKTINIGTGGVSGSTTTITIGSSNGTTTTFNGTVNVTTLDLTNLEVTNIKAKDGTAGMQLADSTGVVSFTANPILSGGTANGVAFLNASKVLTSGSALTFDGTKLVATATTGAATTYPAYFDNSGGGVGTGARIGFRNTAVSYGEIGYLYDGAFATIIDSAGSNNTRFLISGTERARLTADGLEIKQSQLIGYSSYAGIGTNGLAVAGNLGVGTASPAAKVDVSQSQNGQTAVQLTNSNAGASAEATFIANNGTYIGSFGVAGASKSAFGAILASDAYVFSNANVANTGITLMANSANGVIKFATGGSAEKMRLDSSGNLGLGVVPPAGSSGEFIIKASSAMRCQGPVFYYDANVYYNAADRYATTAAATRYVQNSGAHQWWNAPSGTANDPIITFTQAMTLDASGNLLVGVTSPSTGNVNGTIAFGGADAGIVYLQRQTGTDQLRFYTGGNRLGYVNTASSILTLGTANFPLVFATNDTERARITSAGTLNIVGAGTAGTNEAISFNGSTPVNTLVTTSAGRVGIGTDSPTQKLTVNGDALIGTNLFISNAAGSMVGATSPSLYSPASGTLGISTAGTERLRLDASGNLGLGVTPSAWDVGKVMQFDTGGAFVFGDSAQFITGVNAYYQGAWKYTGTGAATKYESSSGQHRWFNAASGTAGNAISFTQAMTLDASGNWLLGKTSAGATGGVEIIPNVSSLGFGRLYLNSGYGAAANSIVFAYAGTSVGIIQQGTASTSYFTNGSAGSGLVGVDANTLGFNTGATERARITSGGYFKASNDGTYVEASQCHELRTTEDARAAIITATNASYTSDIIQIRATRNTTSNSFYAIGYYNTGAAAYKFRVADSGDVTNTNGTYGTISDQKMKTDIVDAGSQWSDIKALRFRKFKMKDDPSGLVQLGVVAQEVELTSPGLVDEHTDRDAEGNDLGTTTKSVKTSILLMKAAVALQEAMARIETLEAEVAALKGA